MNATAHKGGIVMLAAILAASVMAPLLFVTDTTDASPGETESDPLVWWNKTIILLPEVVAGEITDPEHQVLEPPESLVIDWGDGQSEVKAVDGYVTQGSVEIVHTYEGAGTYHITCTPQKAGFIFETYELFMDIRGAPTVFFHDGEEELSRVVAENGYGIGSYEDNYFTKVSAPEDPAKEGKTFSGWYFNDSEFDFGTVIKAPTVLQAHWTDATAPEEPQNVTVTVDGEDVVMAKGKTVADLTVPEKEGFGFEGWFSDEACTVALDPGTVLTDGMRVYSKMTEIPAGDDPAEDDKKDGILSDISVVAVVICSMGAMVAAVGTRVHPAVIALGIALIVAGGLVQIGIIELPEIPEGLI